MHFLPSKSSYHASNFKRSIIIQYTSSTLGTCPSYKLLSSHLQDHYPELPTHPLSKIIEVKRVVVILPQHSNTISQTTFEQWHLGRPSSLLHRVLVIVKATLRAPWQFQRSPSLRRLLDETSQQGNCKAETTKLHEKTWSLPM